MVLSVGGRMFAVGRRVTRLAWPLVIAALVMAQVQMTLPTTTSVACTGSAVACENELPGATEDQWAITGNGSDKILGFTTDISVNAGSTVRFKIDQPVTPVSAYTIEIFRMGYYQGNGARKITNVTPSAAPAKQAPCVYDSAPVRVDCGNWNESASGAVPASAVSGVYFARIRRNSDGEANHVFFVVRNDSSHADVVFQTSDTTWQAYNRYGGNSFYTGDPVGRAYKLSYNRPLTTRVDVPYGQDWVFANE